MGHFSLQKYVEIIATVGLEGGEEKCLKGKIGLKLVKKNTLPNVVP